MKMVDIAIVGAGMVGLSLAAALKESGLKVVVLDKSTSTPITVEPSTRVSAINLASERFLKNINAWEHIVRKQAFSGMSVWEKDSFAQFELTAEDADVGHLGHIIENNQIQQALQASLAGSDIEIWSGTAIQSVTENEQGVVFVLENQQILFSKLVVAADGANSWLRQLVRIPLMSWDYEHSAIVATVRTELPHGNVARQIFTADGPIAFLPLWEENLCSIVWSTSPLKAAALLECDTDIFNHKLSAAFDMKLGLVSVESERTLCPLKARFARDQIKSKFILVGDAAHTIHPLAGQGVNLGFMDAAALAEIFIAQKQNAAAINDVSVLRGYERWRKAEAVQYLAAMEIFKRLFELDNPLIKLIRASGMVLTNQFKPILKPIFDLALGNQGEIPRLAQK